MDESVGEERKELDRYWGYDDLIFLFFVRPAIPDEWDAALVDLMSKIFDKHPASRIKMAELKRHPWVTNEGKLMPLSSSSNSHPGFPNSSPSARRGRWDSEIGTSSQRALVTEKELKESVRSGFTNRCPVFSELVENALKLSAWIPGASSTLSLPHHPPHSHLLRRRKELFLYVSLSLKSFSSLLPLSFLLLALIHALFPSN
jgi:serine/threonine protein kinase